MSTGAARTYWVTGPGRGQIRTEPLPLPGSQDVLVRTRYSGISRGTERLVRHGLVPPSIADRMRAPWQRGQFPWPVAYGYLSVGVVEQGPADLLGRDVFCLHPHQDRYVVPAGAVTLVPDGVPAPRAVLAGTLETAVNACWDLAPLLGDRVAVVGGGMVGASVAALLRTFPLQRLQLVDVDPARAALAEAFGIEAVGPEDALAACDRVVHASGTAAGLATALGLLADEGEVLEMSWYGEADVPAPLGADFHARRLAIRASQVGRISPRRLPARDHRERMRLALHALTDPAFDALLAGPTPFADIVQVMAQVLDADAGPRCHVVDYA